MDSKTFVKEVEKRNRVFYEELEVEKSFMSIRSEDPVKVHKMVRLRLKQGLYNELRVAEVSAAWIPNSPLKAQHLLARQVDDEFRHVRWVQARLKEIGEEEPWDWEPLDAYRDLFDFFMDCTPWDITERIMRVVRVPGVSDIVDFAGGEVKLFGMNVEADSWVAGKTLEELDRAGPPRDSLIAMIFRGQQVIIPHGAEVLLPGDHIYIVATAANLHDVMHFMGLTVEKSFDRVMIIGGKQVGIWVAEALEKQGVNVRLIERDLRRCEKIASILSKTIVVHGDGTDQATLEEENVDGVDAFLALTNDDEDNIIAALLARRLGAKKVVALINRLNYLPMVQRLGINTSVSPRLAAVDRILQFVRKGHVLSVTTFGVEEAEAIELLAAEGSKYVGPKLCDIHFPREAIVGAIARPAGEVIVPRGNASIQAGDRVIFFTLERIVSKLESAFLVEPKKEYV
mgnify:CR=1 FL=1